MALESEAHALLFDGEKGILRWSLRDGTYARSALPSDDPTPWRHLARSPARDLFAATQASKALRVFERATGVERDPKLPGETRCAAFSADGRRLLAGGLKTVHEIELGAESLRVRKVAGQMHIVTAVGYLPDGLHAFSADGHAVKRIERASGRAVTLAGATAASRKQMHPIEGNALVAMVGDAVSLWDVAEDVERARWPLPAGGAWRIVGVDVATGALRSGPAHHGSAALALACSDAPPRVWCASADRRVYAHRLDDGAVVARVPLRDEVDGTWVLDACWDVSQIVA